MQKKYKFKQNKEENKMKICGTWPQMICTKREEKEK
jgi:hypothetical protein